jgi:glycolate oxidase FAD binding subunit
VFHALSPPLLALHQRLKAKLDPVGIFNRRRMYAEF